LFDRFSNHCLANAIEPLRAANTFAGRTLYRWSFLSLDGAQVTSSSGLPVQPDTTLARHPGGDYLFLMPSYGFRDQAGPATARALRSAARRFGALVGMDTGAWLLAAAGFSRGGGPRSTGTSSRRWPSGSRMSR
jgi:AraC family transcriptional regulator, carnitine catabolism transcriptional activator